MTKPCNVCDGQGFLWDRSDREEAATKELCPKCVANQYRHSMMNDMIRSGYAKEMDAKAAQQLANEGCERAAANTNVEIKKVIQKEFDNLLELQIFFSSDDLWDRLDDDFAEKVSNRGGKIIGSIFREASRKGRIYETRESKRSHRLKAKGRKIPIWRKA